jgi:hypothetical protein
MNCFGRALKLALAHRVNVIGCVLTAVVVAVLWGGNLTAVFPVVDVIMNDQSLPQWIDQEIAESDGQVADNRRWQASLEQLPVGQPEQAAAGITAEIALQEVELARHRVDSAEQWNDAQIARKTRLSNFIAWLKKLEGTPPDAIDRAIAQEKQRVAQQIEVYESRAQRFRWFAPAAHRWLPTTPFTTLMVVCVL